jgi:hypothetical protein
LAERGRLIRLALDLLQRCLELCRLEEVHVMYAASAIHLGAALLDQGRSSARAALESVDDLALERAGHYATDYKLITRGRRGRGAAASSAKPARRPSAR